MLDVKQITFSYAETKVIENISFDVGLGDHLSIIGESGSGKSTLLKLLYGKYDLDYGEVLWNKTKILGPKFNLVVGYDFMKYVAQEFDLMPYTSVAENIGQFLSNFYPKEKEERVNELLDVVELTDFKSTKVKLLSGGQKQRVAIARALANAPEIILIDEPFSHIDNFKKHSLRRNVFSYLKEKKTTCILATHDKDDVLAFSDEILVLDKGVIINQGSPQKLYNAPRNKKTAAFFSEFNCFKSTQFKTLNIKSKSKAIICYTHQINLNNDSKSKAFIIDNFFKGSHYIIKANFEGEVIRFNHFEPLIKESEIGFSVTQFSEL